MLDEPVWGIDLGATCVRVVRIARRVRGFEITAVDRIDTYLDPNTSSADALDAGLRKALSIFRVNHRVGERDRIGVAIPGLGFETALFDLPPVDAARTKELVQYEMERRLGSRLAESTWDFAPVPGPSSHERRVLVVFGPTGLVGGYLDAFAATDLHPDRLLLSPFALVEALRTDGCEPREALCVRAGVGLTDLVFGPREGPEIRTEPEGTLWVAQALRERFGLGEKEADGERRAMERGEVNPQFASVASEYAARLIGRIESALAFVRARHASYAPHRVIVAGEGAAIPGVTEALRERFPVPVQVHTTWNRFALAKPLFGKSLAHELSTFSVALGAAIDAATRPASVVSLVTPPKHRALARRMPLVVASTALLGLGVVSADRIVAAASLEATEAHHLVGEIRSQLQAREDLSAGREEWRQREQRAERAWRLRAEWDAWDRALSQVLEALDPSSVILRSRFEQKGDALVGRIDVALPRASDANGTRTPRDFEAVVGSRLRAAGFAEPRLVQTRAIDVLALNAPASANPTHELFAFELAIPVAASGSAR